MKHLGDCFIRIFKTSNFVQTNSATRHFLRALFSTRPLVFDTLLPRKVVNYLTNLVKS